MKNILVLLLFGVLMCAGPSMLAAQEADRAEEAAAEHEETPLQTVFRWANAIVLFGGLAYLLRKPARDFFEGRRQEITSGLKRAQETEAGAKARMNEIEQRLSRLSEEVSQLRAEAEKESVTEREKILAEAKREIARVIEQSRQEIERVARGVERDIKANIADLVVNRAEETLRTEMTEDDQKRVVLRFIKKL